MIKKLAIFHFEKYVWEQEVFCCIHFPFLFKSKLSSTFAQLCDEVDAAKKKVEKKISKLSEDITELEEIESQARLFGYVLLIPGNLFILQLHRKGEFNSKMKVSLPEKFSYNM